MMIKFLNLLFLNLSLVLLGLLSYAASQEPGGSPNYVWKSSEIDQIEVISRHLNVEVSGTSESVLRIENLMRHPQLNIFIRDRVLVIKESDDRETEIRNPKDTLPSGPPNRGLASLPGSLPGSLPSGMSGSNSGSPKPINISSTPIRIFGASKPLGLNILKGDVSLAHWGDEVHLTLLDGKANLQKSKGVLYGVFQKGQLQISDCEGDYHLDILNGQALIRGHQGAINWSAMQGQIQVESSQGNLRMSTYSAKAKINQFTGDISFTSEKSASMKFIDFQGRLEGKANEGGVAVQAIGESEINIESQNARISLESSDGGRYDLSTRTGELNVPDRLMVGTLSNEKIVKGFLMKGESNKSLVPHFRVRSESGSISVR